MIQVYSPGNEDFTKNGDCTLFPASAGVNAVLGGAWTATLIHPLDSEGRWRYLVEEAVVKMPSFNGDQLFRIQKPQNRTPESSAQWSPFSTTQGTSF